MSRLPGSVSVALPDDVIEVADVVSALEEALGSVESAEGEPAPVVPSGQPLSQDSVSWPVCPTNVASEKQAAHSESSSSNGDGLRFVIQLADSGRGGMLRRACPV